MSVLTRIKNNQITDSTILANTKIVPGSIVGSLFNSNLTMTSDVTITGNLTVQGSSTYLTVASTNTYVNDPLIVMNNAFAGTNTNDIGLLFNRGSDTNQAFIWDESEDEFRLISTSETGTTYGNVTTSSYANVRVGNLNVEGAAAFGSLSTSGSLAADNLVLSGDLAVNGGDITSTATTFNLLTDDATTVNAFTAATTLELGAATGTTNVNNNLDVDGNVNIDGSKLTTAASSFDLLNTTATTVNFAGAATTLTLAATSGNTAIQNNLDVGLTLTAQDINDTVIGNVIPAAATFTTATVQGNTSLGLTEAEAINNTPIGNAVPSTGSFTTLLSSGVTQVTDTSAATSIGTGAFRVDGGASVSGNLWVGGNINVVGNTFTISGNTGQFFGDINGFGALYAGVTGFTSLPQTVFQVAADVNNYAQVNFENVNTGADASTDYVATAGNGDDLNHYINMGITSPNWDGTQENSLTTALSGNDGYLYAQGDAGNGGNLVIGASTPNRTVSVIVGGNTASNITAVYRAPGTTSTSTTTGALTVVGGVGVTGNLNADNVYANNLSTSGEIAAADLTLTGDLGVNGGDITTTATTFNLLDSTATTVNAFGAATAIDLGATTGTLTINNPTVVGSSTTQDLYNTTATTLNFAGAATTLNIGADTGTATINNDTVNLEGNVNVNQTTPSTNSTTGALVVDGGVGIAGNLNIGENVVITGNLTVQGAVTTLNTATLDVEDLNITVAKGATDSAAADGAGLTVDGASASLLYNHATTSWDLNKITRVTDTTDTTDETTGALRVAGGVAIAKDLFVGGGDIITDETTFNLLDATVTTLNIGGAATAIDLGATTGTLTINNPTVVGSQTTQDLYNTTATTVNFAGAATTLTIGAVTGTTNIRNALVDIDGNATVGGTLGVTGDTTLTGDLAVNGGDLTTTAGAFNLLNTTFQIDAFANASTITLGGSLTSGGLITINHAEIAGAVSTPTVSLWSTSDTSTVNFATKASTVTIGGTSGNTTVQNNLIVGGALTARDMNGTVIGNVTPAAATFTNVTDQSLTATRVTFAGTGGDLVDSANFTFDANILTVKNFSINGDTAEISVIGGSGNVVLNPDTGGVIDATNSLISNVADPVNAQDVVTLSYLATELSAATTVLLSDDTDLTVTDDGNVAGVITANVDATRVFDISSTSASWYTDFVTFDDANSNVAITGTAHISSDLTVLGQTTIGNATASTSYTNGAVVITGGVGIGGALNLANGAVINESQSTENFQVKGETATTLIYADSANNTVTIGGSNTTPVSGATLRVNGTGAMILPVGPTNQRPGATGNTDVQGMMRFNSSLGILEYYDGSAWQSTQGAFTVITSESFNGDGVTAEFTLSSSSTTSATVVAINGVLQVPVISYSIVGTALTFTEAPEVGDIIDVRKLVSTSTVTSLNDGFSAIELTSNSVSIATGTSSSIVRLAVDTAGTATFTNNVNVNGVIGIKGLNEAFTTKTAATGVVVHNYSTGSIFEHSSISSNFTINITNLTLPSGNVGNVTVILNQGTTPYIPNAIQIAGVAQTINWQGGTPPTGNADKKDIVTFTILNNSGTYTVFGNLATYG
jgi:hypothetical protein